MNKRINIARIACYCIGMLSLAMGLTLNTKSHLGVAAVMSTPYSLSEILEADYGNITLLFYILFVIIEIIIHAFFIKYEESHSNSKRYQNIVLDVAQIGFSLVFTRFLNIFKDNCPDPVIDLADTPWNSFPGKLLILFLGILLTGIGASMMLNARIIPNPADGIVQAFSDLTGKDLGFIKNCLDAVCVAATCVVSLILAGRLVGIGIGTILSLIGVGRVVAISNKMLARVKSW